MRDHSPALGAVGLGIGDLRFRCSELKIPGMAAQIRVAEVLAQTQQLQLN